MDNVFSELKSSLAMPEVARFYGLEVNRAGMACCPFHDDKSSSLKVYDDHFYCFGCAKRTSSHLLRQIDAAKKISEDFGLGLFDRGIAAPIKIAPPLTLSKCIGLFQRKFVTVRRSVLGKPNSDT